MSKRYQKYKKVIDKATRKYQKKNPDKVKRWREEYALGRSKKVILLRDNYQCQICGDKENLEIHHIDGNGTGKLKKDKNNNLDNLITLCRKCHSKIDGWKIRKKGWSRKFEKCIMCGTTKRKYHSNGLCSQCYEKTRKEYKSQWYKKKN